MKELKKIQLIESPKKEICLGEDGMSFLLGGNGVAYNCPNEFSSTTIGTDTCSHAYSDGNCGSASNYCHNYSSCFFEYSK
jgi:hypothetical protein